MASPFPVLDDPEQNRKDLRRYMELLDAEKLREENMLLRVEISKLQQALRQVTSERFGRTHFSPPRSTFPYEEQYVIAEPDEDRWESWSTHTKQRPSSSRKASVRPKSAEKLKAQIDEQDLDDVVRSLNEKGEDHEALRQRRFKIELENLKESIDSIYLGGGRSSSDQYVSSVKQAPHTPISPYPSTTTPMKSAMTIRDQGKGISKGHRSSVRDSYPSMTSFTPIRPRETHSFLSPMESRLLEQVTDLRHQNIALKFKLSHYEPTTTSTTAATPTHASSINKTSLHTPARSPNRYLSTGAHNSRSVSFSRRPSSSLGVRTNGQSITATSSYRPHSTSTSDNKPRTWYPSSRRPQR